MMGNRFDAKVAGHDLVWEPGWPGKGMYHNGELTTWGVNSNSFSTAWPHHTHMWGEKYPSHDFPEAVKSKQTLLFNIEPDGRVREAHPFEGEWPHEIYQIDPRLQPWTEEESWESMFSKVADWYDDAWESPFPEHIEPWQPPHPGKGVVSPEGRAFTWKVNGPFDGYPSHSQGLAAVGVKGGNESEIFHQALNGGWSFFDLPGDGSFNHIAGPPEHKEVMQAHMPQETRCGGCGAAVETDQWGEYKCPHCRWQGISNHGYEEESWEDQFS
jgi:hypothetical protein